MKWLRWAVAAAVALPLGADAIPYTAASAPMMARAEEWFQAQPRYDQDACYRVEAGYARTDWNGVLGGCHEPYYRTDCSGFVSMVWGLPVSYATPRQGLDHWTNASRTTYVAYDFGATPVKHQEYTWNAPGEYAYVPIRYTPDH